VTEAVLRTLAEQLMAAEVDARCRTASGERVNRRNGYRDGAFVTPLATVAVRVPKLRQGTYSPTWLRVRSPAADEVLTAAVLATAIEPQPVDVIGGIAAAFGIHELPDARLATIAAAVEDQAALGRPLPVPQPAPARRDIEIVVHHHGRRQSGDDGMEEIDERRSGHRTPVLLAAVAALALVAAVAAGWSSMRFGPSESRPPASVPPNGGAMVLPATVVSPPPLPAAVVSSVAPAPEPAPATPPTPAPDPSCAAPEGRQPFMEAVRCEAAGA